MHTLRPAGERGHFNFEWLDTFHTFSFGEYRDPRWMGFHNLRVINEDRVSPGRGFAPHSHRDMEILTYLLSGTLQHRDSMGNGSLIQPGEIQRMSAGTGVTHSEFNASADEEVHLLQIWILPGRSGDAPGYEQKTLPNLQNRLQLIAAPEPGEGLVQIHADARLYAARLQAGASIEQAAARPVWVQLARGAIEVNGLLLHAGDGVAFESERELKFSSVEDSEFLVFHLEEN